MTEPKILVLDHHGHGKNHERTMNIACAVVITVVVLAMIVATIVYFCSQKKNGQEGSATQTGLKQMPTQPVKTVTKQTNFGQVPTNGATPSSIPPFGAPVMSNPPPVPGIPVPKLSQQDEAALAKSGQLKAVKNYAQGQRNAYLKAIDRTYVPSPQPLHRGDYDPYVRNDEMQYQRQTKMLQQGPKQNFNQSEQYYDVVERNQVTPLL